MIEPPQVTWKKCLLHLWKGGTPQKNTMRLVESSRRRCQTAIGAKSENTIDMVNVCHLSGAFRANKHQTNENAVHFHLFLETSKRTFIYFITILTK